MKKIAHLMSLLAVIVIMAAGCTNGSASVAWRTKAEMSREVKTPQAKRTTTSASGNEQFVSHIAAKATVAELHSPRDGDAISTDVFTDVTGRVEGLERGTELWVIARDQYNWFPQMPPAMVDRSGHFEQANVRLATTGDNWRLAICSVPTDARRIMERAIARNEWALQRLPEGVEILDMKSVSRVHK